MEELSRDEGFPNKNEDDVQKWMVKYLQFKCTLEACLEWYCVWGKLVIQTTNFFPNVLGKCSV